MGFELDTKHPDEFPPLDYEEKLTSEVDWTKEEETAARRKLDFIIIPPLFLGFFCLILDVGNIANALTDTFLKDVGITQDQFNVGQQMLSIGVLLAEIPSNMILYRLGPAKWLTIKIFMFGMVATFQAFQTNYSSFLATRFLLGASESGFVAGSLWALSRWYTKKETATRFMLFFFGAQFGQASSKLLAYGLLQMRGVGGRPGWFWLFFTTGALTLASGFVLGFFLLDSFNNPSSAFLPGKTPFTDRQLHILKTRVQIDDPMKLEKKKSLDWDAFKRTLMNWRIWIHVLISFCNSGPHRGFGTYTPSIIHSFGYQALISNALASIGLYLQIPTSFTFSWISDRFNKRGETVLVGMGLYLLGFIFNRIFTELRSRGVRYFGVIWTQCFGGIPHPLNIAWLSLACSDSEVRSLALSMSAMGGNIAAIYGAQLFRHDDAPKYRRAFGMGAAILSVAIILGVVRYIDDIICRRKAAKEVHFESDDSDSEIDKPLPLTERRPARIGPNFGDRST
ncbi:hypothetical protein TWF694_007637 [Orbilia ellipsospora]|uniref:Major facilitator superfamily (MFS) profile domain-containing protein n=1 Tax=Orbilia ellipsospora TaxID=2528407 RepID=A0AAV9XKW9_9PEZI